MEVHDVFTLVGEQRRRPEPWREFLRVKALSVGLYKLQAGEADVQEPHSEDEVYYVLEGRGVVRVGTGEHAVYPGALVYVGAHVEHRFHSIQEELVLLVFFAPAEGSLTSPSRP